jgi:hypothetical protein
VLYLAASKEADMRMDTVDDFIYRRFGDQIYKNIKHHLERVSEELERLSYSFDNPYSANERFKYIKSICI